MWVPVFECVVGVDGEGGYRVGHELIDQFLEFVGARARPNTVNAEESGSFGGLRRTRSTSVERRRQA